MPSSNATSPTFALLPARAIVALSGEDRATFIQALISNDVLRVGDTAAIYAALLTPQGKYLHDFFIAEANGRLLIDCERERAADLRRRLSLYKLRSRVTIAEASDLAVAALWGDGAAATLGLTDVPGQARAFAGGVVFVDPRLPILGLRAILPAADCVTALEAAGFAVADSLAYERQRLTLGLPDGSRDMMVEKSLPLECGLDDLNGIDWKKGCYMGQELTARMRYRGLVKKRMLPVRVEGPLPAPGTAVFAGEREAGEIRSGCDQLAVALLRLEFLQPAADTPLTAGDARITPFIPPWARLPAATGN